MSKSLQQIIQGCQGQASLDLRKQIMTASERSIILYFFRRGFSPRCRLQAQDFCSQHDNFLSLNTQIIGISRESAQQQLDFSRTMKITFPLVSDEEDELCHAFGLLHSSQLGQKQILKLKPSTFLFSPTGKLVKFWHDCQEPGMVQQVLNQCQAQWNLEQRSAS